MTHHLIIIGTVKSGSSTLYKYLADHPETHFSKVKEYNFFMNMGYAWGQKNNWKKFKRQCIFTIASVIPFLKRKVIDRYSQVSDNKEGFYSGDGSINYFYFPEVPKRIKTFVPNSKLILIFRNPKPSSTSWWT